MNVKMSKEENFVFVYHNNYAEMVTTNFQTFLENDLYIDLIFVCRDNKKIGAHQVVLGCLSKFFYSVFVENQLTIKEKVLHIYVPDIRAKIMKYILQFIYTGRAMLNETELDEFNEDIKLLGMPLDHFSKPSEATENNETPLVKPPRKSAPRVVADTVDLTDTSPNDEVTTMDGNSNINESSSRAEVTTPAAIPTAFEANSNDISTPPVTDKNPSDVNPSAKSSEAENRATSTSSSCSSDVTKRKLSTQSEPENRTTSTNSSCSSDVTKRKLSTQSEPENRTTSTNAGSNSDVTTNKRKSSESENRTPTSSSNNSTTTVAPENKSNVVKSRTIGPKIPENNMIPNGDCTKKRSKNAPLPSKRGKYVTDSIDLDASDDDDVITLS